MEHQDRKAILKQLLAIGIPISLQNLISIGVSFVDTLMIGQLGEVQLGGVNQANQPYFFFAMLVFGLSIGSVVISARYWGNRDVEPIKVICGLSMRICIFLGIVCSAVVLLFPEKTMLIFADDPEVVAEGVKYLNVIAWTYPFTAFTGSYLVNLRGVGDVKVSMYIYLTSCLMNVVLNWILIFGNLGAPQLGVTGAAIATAICRITEAVLTLFYMLFAERKINFKLRYIFARSREYWGTLLRYGLPVLVTESIWSIGMTVQASIIGHLGVNVLAAYSVIYVVQDLASVMMVGFVNGSLIILSGMIGSGHDEEASYWSGRFNLIGVGFGVLMAAAILIVRPFTPSMIVCTEETAEMLLDMMYVSAALMFFLAISWNISGGTLRAGGDTYFCAVVDTISFFVIKVCVGMLGAFVLKLDPILLYALLCSDELFKGLLYYLRMRQGGWMHMKLNTAPEG